MYCTVDDDATSDYSHYHGDCLKREHHQSPVLITDHSSDGDLVSCSYKLLCFGSTFMIRLVKRACSLEGEGERCVQGFGGEN
jgi:hypothetical protein